MSCLLTDSLCESFYESFSESPMSELFTHNDDSHLWLALITHPYRELLLGLHKARNGRTDTNKWAHTSALWELLYGQTDSSTISCTPSQKSNKVGHKTGPRYACRYCWWKKDRGVRKVIEWQTTSSYSPHQNGVAERCSRTFFERTRAMLYDSGLPSMGGSKQKIILVMPQCMNSFKPPLVSVTTLHDCYIRYDYEEFRQGPLVAVEFATHAINFRTKSKPDRTFNYNFRLHSTYLVDGDWQEISTLSRMKRGPDAWLVSFSRHTLWGMVSSEARPISEDPHQKNIGEKSWRSVKCQLMGYEGRNQYRLWDIVRSTPR